MVCHACNRENAVMNLICAYCGVELAERHAVMRAGSVFLVWTRWVLLAIALLLPIVGLAIGLAQSSKLDDESRSTGRQWLIAGLCSSLVYLLALLR